MVIEMQPKDFASCPNCPLRRINELGLKCFDSRIQFSSLSVLTPELEAEINHRAGDANNRIVSRWLKALTFFTARVFCESPSIFGIQEMTGNVGMLPEPSVNSDEPLCKIKEIKENPAYY